MAWLAPVFPMRIVIKIGSGVLARNGGVALNHALIARLTQAISDLREAGHQCVVVSSGAVAAGLKTFGLDARPEDIGQLQACAAVGQARLMHTYESHFSQFGVNVAQLLLTGDDFSDDRRRANITTTLSRLLDAPNIVPIINENDSVAVFELKVGDNDLLSAHVAKTLQADLLILLTSVAGLRPPESTSPDDIVELVTDIDAVLAFASEEKGSLSVGGMRSKLEAVRIAVSAGITTLIASGHNPEQLSELVAGGGIATRFPASVKTM